VFFLISSSGSLGVEALIFAVLRKLRTADMQNKMLRLAKLDVFVKLKSAIGKNVIGDGWLQSYFSDYRLLV
jgi:hypothetical protein